MAKLLLILMMVGVWSGCGKEIEVVVDGNEEYEIYRDETNNKPVKHGYYKEYYPDKSYKTTVNYVDGKEEGKWIGYYKSGKVEVEGNYVDGKVEGKEVWYDEEGNITDEDIYKDGECVEMCEEDDINPLSTFLP